MVKHKSKNDDRAYGCIKLGYEKVDLTNVNNVIVYYWTANGWRELKTINEPVQIMYILKSDSCLYRYAQDWINECGVTDAICVSNICYRNKDCTVSQGTGVYMINKDNRRSASCSGRGSDSNIPKMSAVWDGKLMK